MAKNKRPSTTKTKKTEEKVVETVENPVKVDKKDTTEYIKTSVVVKYSHSSECKLAAITKSMIIEDIYKAFISNPKCFIGLNSSRDLEKIKKAFYDETLLIDHKKLMPSVRDMFIEFLVDNSKFVKARLS
jgi:hypothetical protein